MCGILGIAAANGAGKSPTLDRRRFRTALEVLFRQSQSRGSESSGLVVRTDDALLVFKEPRPASVLTRAPAYAEMLDAVERGAGPRCVIGHSRMATNGTPDHNRNNQPLAVAGLVGVHNGIVTNDAELWKRFPDLAPTLETDSEALLAVLARSYRETGSAAAAACRTYPLLEGMASIAVLFEDSAALLLATNTGSLHWCRSRRGDAFVFASQDSFLRALARARLFPMSSEGIRQMKPGTGCVVDLDALEPTLFDLRAPPPSPRSPRRARRIEDRSKTSPSGSSIPRQERSVRRHPLPVEFDPDRPFRRCTRCILPETMPFIRFDAQGVCNFCHDFRPPTPRGEHALRALVEPHRRASGRPDCIVSLSGGRDSSFTLHYVKTVLGMNPVAFSYDWGMMTPAGRRNQSRMCAKTGVEHILVSADIAAKRRNIRKNVEAWCRSPDLGTVPLFMAGDKQFYRLAYGLRRQLGVELVFLGEHPLESTNFKSGFAGTRLSSNHEMAYGAPLLERVKLARYYGRQCLVNPAYINASLLDTLDAFFSFYVLPHDYVNLYTYVPWDESRIIPTLRDGYDWERAPDTESTWRIDDGTAAFYNYIYYTVAGLSEHDTFLSNQVRWGLVTREDAVVRSAVLNRPREPSLRWYFDTIGVDGERVLRVVNAMPKRRGAVT